jgi:hypothetical protein
LVDKEPRVRRQVWEEDAEVASKCKRDEAFSWQHERALLGIEDLRAKLETGRRKGRKETIDFLETRERQNTSEAHDNHESGCFWLVTDQRPTQRS